MFSIRCSTSPTIDWSSRCSRSAETLNTAAVKQIASVTNTTADPLRSAIAGAPFVEPEPQIEFGDIEGHELPRHGQAGQFEWRGGGVVLQLHHDLEQWLVRGRAGRVEDFDQVFERQILVGIGGQVGSAHARKQFAEAGIAGGVGAQHQGVGQRSRTRSSSASSVRPAIGQAAEWDVGAGAQPGEQDGDGGVQNHEQSGLAAARQIQQPAVQAGIDVKAQMLAAIAGPSRARPGSAGRLSCSGRLARVCFQ